MKEEEKNFVDFEKPFALSLESSYRDDIVMIRVKGDIEREERFLELNDACQNFIDNGHNKIIVDVTEVSFMAPSALGMLYSLRRQCQRGGGDLKILNPGEGFLRYFFQPSSLLHIYYKEKEVLADLRG